MADLRTLSIDAFSDRLNSPRAEDRVRPAADIRCFINLIDHVVKNTRFRKKVRLLKVSQVLEACAPRLEECYSSAPDIKAGRKKAVSLLKRQLERLFSEMPSDEKAEIKKRRDATLAALEQKVMDDGSDAVEQLQQQGADSGDSQELTEDEQQLGVQIGRVEMRVAGKNKRIPQKIMPDPDNPEQFVIAQRDPDTNELVPQMRRGAKRIVEKNRDGTWKTL